MNLADAENQEEDDENNNTLNFLHDPNVPTLPSDVQMQNQESPFKKKVPQPEPSLSAMKKLNL